MAPAPCRTGFHGSGPGMAVGVGLLMTVLMLSASRVVASEFSGDKQCPCFCDRRVGDRYGSYWVDNYGTGPVDGTITCGTACVDPAVDIEVSNVLGVCKDIVTYRFCGLALNDTTPASRPAARDSFLLKLSEDVSTCISSTAGADHKGACAEAVLRNACYRAFPRCNSNSLAVGICHSDCMHQIMTCRTLNSDYGSKEQIEGHCAQTGFEAQDIDGSLTDLCTGAAAQGSSISYIVLTAAAGLLLALFAS